MVCATVECDNTVLWQTWSFDYSTDIGNSDIQQKTGITASTIPDLNPAGTDFVYGDPREMLAASTQQALVWSDFCR